jgi:hypothetical protein
MKSTLHPAAKGTTSLIGLSGKPAFAVVGTINSKDRHSNQIGIKAEVSFAMDARMLLTPVGLNEVLVVACRHSQHGCRLERRFWSLGIANVA